MAEHHRKIELQSPDDLQYLISNVRRAANEKIDKDLPPIEGEDKMRRRVEEMVQEVCPSPIFPFNPSLQNEAVVLTRCNSTSPESTTPPLRISQSMEWNRHQQ